MYMYYDVDGMADIGTLEMLDYNLKSIRNLINLNMSFTLADIINCQLN